MDMNLGNTRLIIDACMADGLLRNECAYVLATTRWETAHTMRPIREMGDETYLKGKAYYPYVGMGYVQLTWRRNYEFAGRKLGVDFVANPKLLLDHKFAVRVLIAGMREGWFTGKRLSDYITLAKSDYKGARRIVNGTDKATEIAALAAQYEGILKAEGYGVSVPQKPTPPAAPPARANWLSALIDAFLKLFKKA